MKKETLCVRGGGFKEETGALSVPIYQSATFAHPELGHSTGYDYSRLQNPTRKALEDTVAALEGGVDAIAYSSGMAAISGIMELFETGSHIIACEDLYGGAIRLMRTISSKNGLSFSFVDTAKISNIESAVTPSTKAVFLEIPTNPMMGISDITEIAKLCKKRGLQLIVDNTFLTPYFLRPIELGADIVTHSGTKYLGGHNDTLAGLTIYKDRDTADRARVIAKTVGACLAPFDSWLMLRGIKTLAVRMDRIESNAKAIAAYLATHPMVKRVLYAGLSTHPGHAVLKRQASGFGGMISMEVDSHATLVRVLKEVRIISFAESLGGVETLITYPSVQTHADVPNEEKERRGINDRLLRLSVGIESVEDLIEDLGRALG